MATSPGSAKILRPSRTECASRATIRRQITSPRCQGPTSHSLVSPKARSAPKVAGAAQRRRFLATPAIDTAVKFLASEVCKFFVVDLNAVSEANCRG
jgi:hypothetical protein